MNRLTHERVNGIKTGYWSDCKKEDLIKALAAYENTGYEQNDAGYEPEYEQGDAEYQQGEAEFQPVIPHADEEEDRELGDVNPYTGKEYQSNSVRMHPTRIGYVQVYDRTIHKWTDMTEWAFLGYQERKKVLLGKAYEPPIYLD